MPPRKTPEARLLQTVEAAYARVPSIRPVQVGSADVSASRRVCWCASRPRGAHALCDTVARRAWQSSPLPCTDHPVVGVQEQVEVSSPSLTGTLWRQSRYKAIASNGARVGGPRACLGPRRSCCGVRSSCGWMCRVRGGVLCGRASRVLSRERAVGGAYGGDPCGYQYLRLEARLAVCGVL